MKILLLHGWLRGNLGDECITRVLVAFLRERFPRAFITLVTEPIGPWRVSSDLLSLIDQLIERPFQMSQDDLISDSSVVIQVPGGGYQEDPHPDARAPYMFRDAETCHRFEIPHVVAGHSFHPSYDHSPLRGSFVIAREPVSMAVLTSQGVPAVLSADPAFLVPSPPSPSAREGSLLFLRRWHFKDIRIDGQTVHLDDRHIPVPERPLILASSDPFRDDAILVSLQHRYELFYERCFDLQRLLFLINGAAHVISDRYHPVIFAAIMGVPFTFLPRHGNSRDEGLLTHLQDRSLQELSILAREGMSSMEAWIRERL